MKKCWLQALKKYYKLRINREIVTIKAQHLKTKPIVFLTMLGKTSKKRDNLYKNNDKLSSLTLFGAKGTIDLIVVR